MFGDDSNLSVAKLSGSCHFSGLSAIRPQLGAICVLPYRLRITHSERLTLGMSPPIGLIEILTIHLTATIKMPKARLRTDRKLT